MAFPAFTLMSVAKPWIVESPTPSISQTESGVTPLVCEFSHVTGLIVAPQGDPEAYAAGASRPMVNPVTLSSNAARAAMPPRRRVLTRDLTRPDIAASPREPANVGYPRTS